MLILIATFNQNVGNGSYPLQLETFQDANLQVNQDSPTQPNPSLLGTTTACLTAPKFPFGRGGGMDATRSSRCNFRRSKRAHGMFGTRAPGLYFFFLYNVDTVRVSQFAKLGLGYAGTNMDCLKASRKAVGVPILHCNNCHSLKLQ